VLVTYHPPTILTPLTHPLLIAADDPSIRSLTNTISTSIRSGTLDSPSWSYIRLSHTARRLYAPHGTGLGLGDHVRLTQRFVDVFAKGKESARWVEGMDPRASLKGEMREKGEGGTKGEDLVILAGDLKVSSPGLGAMYEDTELTSREGRLIKTYSIGMGSKTIEFATLACCVVGRSSSVFSSAWLEQVHSSSSQFLDCACGLPFLSLRKSQVSVRRRLDRCLIPGTRCVSSSPTIIV
jgi:hypothetical protein